MTGLSQIDSEENQTMEISVCSYDSNNNIESIQSSSTPKDPPDPEGYMTSGIMIEAKVMIVRKNKVVVLKIDVVDLIEFKRLVSLQKKNKITLRMDEIENRRGFNAGLRILKALLHGNEPNQHSKIYHDENLMGIRKMFLPKYSTPKDVGKITHSPSISDFPHKNVMAAWFDPSNVKVYEKFIKERRFRKVAETDLELGPKLNTEQMLAVVLACTGQICLIQGPPGTGKTFTLMSILRCLVTMRNRYNRGRFHEDVESIMNDLRKNI